MVGAGLAGAAVSSELARHGWHITLMDASSGPARGASGLPVGMLSPHVTRAPTPLSRLSKLGMADTLAELKRLVPEGHGWQACEVDNLNHDAGRWPAALVRPAALVNAWMQEAQACSSLTCLWDHPVTALQPYRWPDGSSGWEVQARAGQLAVKASVVVVCAAVGSLRLLSAASAATTDNAFPLRPVKGQLSFGPLSGGPLADRPQRDSGVFVPCYEDAGLDAARMRRIWSMGSTYTRGDNSTHVTTDDHQRNLDSLSQFNPAAAAALKTALAQGQVEGWAQVRCASLDRLPLVGALPDLAALGTAVRNQPARRSRLKLQDVPRLPGLFTVCALGSRGITLAHWCAKMLVRRIEHQAIDAEGDLLEAIDPARFAWRDSRRQQPSAICS